MMQREPGNLTNQVFDLLIVGGGIYGACAAWEAVSRGLKVALVEKTDFGHASSANHLKMVHGGIRYLQHGDIVRIRESCRERSAMLRVAPHLVEPLSILIPTYGHGMKGKEVLGVAMGIYDLLTLDRNRQIPDPRRHVPRGAFLSAGQVAEILPGIERRGLTGAAVFCDGQMYNPPRLTLAFLRSAAEAGAVVANYSALEKLDIQAGRITGAVVKDLLSGATFSLQCKNVLLTTGGWTAPLLQAAAGITLDPAPAFSRDLAFIINRPLLNGQYGFACPLKTKDADAMFDRGGRHLFVAPWRGKTLVGVWHGIFNKPPEEVATSETELAGFLAEVNEAYPQFNLTLADVCMVLTGLTLFGDSSAQEEGKLSFGKRSMLINHAQTDNVRGLMSLIGVRATTARGMAEKALDRILENLGAKRVPSVSTRTPVFGGDFSSLTELAEQVADSCQGRVEKKVQDALLRNYGNEFQRVLNYGDRDAYLLTTIGTSSVIGAEVVHAVREEMAMTLNDVVFRRTDLGTLGGLDTEQVMACARIMAQEAGWSTARLAEEASSTLAQLERRGFIKDPLQATGTDR